MRRKWKNKIFDVGRRMHMKILILCIGCTLTALLVQTFLFQEASSSLIYRQSKEEIENSLQNLQDDMYSFLKRMETGMIDIYLQEDFITDLKKNVEIDELQNDYYRLAFNMGRASFDTSDGLLAMYIYRADHVIISTYRKAMTPKHNYPEDIFEDVSAYRADKVKEYVESDDAVTFVSSYYNTYREKNILRLVMKIYNYGKNSQVLGYIVCDIDTKTIQQSIEKYFASADAFYWMQPEGDRAVFQMGEPDEEERESIKQLQLRIEAGEEGGEKPSEDYGKVFFSVAQKKYNLTAYALMPQEYLQENQKILTRNLMLIAAMAICLAVLISWFISRTLTRPLENMTATAKQIKEGNTQLRMQRFHNDEIGELAQSFNEMLDQIETLVGREYEAQLSLNQAKYNALQAQINPHFLYNTLDTMSSIADIKGCPEVSALSQSLSNIFRYSLDMKNPFSTVAGEIAHLKNYIYVMNVRMREDIEYVFDVEDTILKSSMPRISIQPLVENALTHGLRRSRKKKRIVITARKQGDNLVISVEDNGIGIPEEEQKDLLAPNRAHHTKSVGLNNIHSRLQILYGEAYGVTIESRVGEGTKVSILIPSVRMEELELWKKKNTES